MTISDFMSNLSSHGVEENIDYGLFINYLNTTLFKIYNDVIIPKKGQIYSHGIKPIKIIEEIQHHNNVEKTIELRGVAFSMRICGVNYIHLNTGGETKLVSCKSDDNVFRAMLVNGQGTLTLGGKNAYTIYDLCIFDDVPSLLAGSLPSGLPIEEYDVSEKYVDFGSFLSPAVDRFGNIIEQVKTVDSKLIVDSYYKGDIIFTYRRRPVLTHPNYEGDIDIPEKYEVLLIPLFLYFYYVELDDDKSKSYIEIYKHLLENIVYPTNNASIECDKVVTNGW